MITIKDMAEELGVSTTTVSNVINGKSSEVSQKTVERVEKLLKETGYVPNINARNLAQNRTKIIGVAIKGRKDKYENVFADPFFGELLGSIEATIHEAGYFMMIYSAENTREIIQYVNGWNVEGLILIGMVHDDHIRIKTKYKHPIVLIDSYPPKEVGKYVNIGLEDEKGAYMVTKYLLDCGHRKVAFLADNVEGVDYIRYTGYLRAYQEYGLEADPENLIIIRPGQGERKRSMEEICKAVHNYTAFMCCSDYYAATLINFLQEKGVRIPEDLSITGFDDNIFSRIVRPALTTIKQDITKKGQLSVQYLIQLLEGNAIQQNDYRLPAELIIRDSVKILNENKCNNIHEEIK